MNRFLYNIFLLFTAAALTCALGSCRDDVIADLEEGETPESIFGNDVYTLDFVVTLDDLGTRANGASNDPQQIVTNENYINLERFRVLFFDNQDRFLFESKNRWIKEVSLGNGFSSWFVSIPFGAFGNDSYGEGREYDWDNIRNYLTSSSFKIAILVNRPAQLLYPGFTDSELSLPEGHFDNDGPYWGPGDVGKKTIFDLHHSQYDIIYADKGNHKGGSSAAYYDFVMGDIKTDQPTMGAAINWVSFDNGDTDKVQMGSSSTYMRHIKMPGPDHPIPMYGIQIFDPIPKELWKKGTPFDLSNVPADAMPDEKYGYRTIALLRSCVRLDLLIPKTVKNGAKPQFVSLWYSNIYSRCEPMDTWTPTNELWAPDHDNGCEWEHILNYGPVSSNVAPGNQNSKSAYQERISWFYGAWKGRWNFQTLNNTVVTPVAETATTRYPHIFNTCIQRNKVITCLRGDVSNYYNDDYHHFVVYTGERNCNDPNTLPDMTKNPYIACFVISWDLKNYYCIPLLNYAKNTDPDLTGVFGPHTDDVFNNGNWPAKMNTYIGTLTSERGNNLPYPLLRNHIYRFTLKGTRAGDDGDPSDLFVESEVVQSPTINFTERVRAVDVRGRLKGSSSQSTAVPIRK
ncbi:MAG: hypothetical protein J1F07_02035 [Muribaculaceae bacterium]|nr:hypothetical protein [Muribaculaceae bacterium]